MLRLIFSYSPVSSFASLHECAEEAKNYTNPCLCLKNSFPNLPPKPSSPLRFFKSPPEAILLSIERNESSSELTIKISKKML